MRAHVFPRDLGKEMAKTAPSFDNKAFRMIGMKAELEELYRQLLIKNNCMTIWQ